MLSMTNDKIYTQERGICSAYIDSGLKLGIAQAVLMVQDNLVSHRPFSWFRTTLRNALI